MKGSAVAVLMALVLAFGASALADNIPKSIACDAYEGIRKDASDTWECYPTAAVSRVMVDQQAGADACVKLQAAIDEADGGGIVDARNLSAVESCSGLDLCDVHSVTVLLGPTRFNVTQPIYITGSSSITFIGTGASHQEGHDYGTVFVWASSDPDEAMFNIQLSRELRFEGFRVQAESQDLFAGFRMVAAASSGSTCQATETTTNNTFENITVMGQNNNGAWTLDRGFFWDDCGDPQDPTAEGTCSFNNDGTALRDVSVSNYSNAAYYITGFNSKSHTFLDCGFQGKNHLTTVDPGDYGIYLRSGSFRWYGGAGMGGGNEEADFYLMKNTDTILISGANLEKSERLLQTGFSTSPWAVTVEGVRWASDRMGSGNYAVDYQKHGTLTLTGNLIGSDPVKPLEMRVKGRAIAIGNHITSSAGTAEESYRDLFKILGDVGASWTLLDNVIKTSSGSA